MRMERSSSATKMCGVLGIDATFQVSHGSLETYQHGIDNVNLDPAPAVLVTVTLPPCNSAISRTSASPNPVPGVSASSTRGTRKNFSKTLTWCSGGIPYP